MERRPGSNEHQLVRGAAGEPAHRASKRATLFAPGAGAPTTEFARRRTASVRLGVPVTLAPPAGGRTRGGCSYQATPEASWLIALDRGPGARRCQAARTPGAQRPRATLTRAGATLGRTSTSSSTPHSSANTHSSRITQALESPHLAPDSSPGSSHRHGLNTPVQPAIPLPHMVNGFAKVA